MNSPIAHCIFTVLRCGLFLCNYTACFSQEERRTVPVLIPSPAVEEKKLAVVLRIPHALIAKAVNQDFQHTAPVARVMLGTRSQGIAHCQGAVTCDLVEQSTGALMRCRIVGSVQSETCGINGPASISARSTTCYEAQKFALFDGRRFTTRPATLQSTTKVVITGVGSSLPGLRGRIVRRVASKRSTESHDQAEAITAQISDLILRSSSFAFINSI